MSDLFAPVERWAAALIERMQPAQRQRLSLAIAKELRAATAKNIAAQQSPDGIPWEPRKTQAKRKNARSQIRNNTRKGAMFRKLRTAAHLRTLATPDTAVVEIAGRSQRIARVHHEGLTDTVNEYGTTYRYPARPLLGLSEQDEQTVKTAVMQHLLRDA